MRKCVEVRKLFTVDIPDDEVPFYLERYRRVTSNFVSLDNLVRSVADIVANNASFLEGVGRLKLAGVDIFSNIQEDKTNINVTLQKEKCNVLEENYECK